MELKKLPVESRIGTLILRCFAALQKNRARQTNNDEVAKIKQLRKL
jgi:hypothetical protein